MSSARGDNFVMEGEPKESIGFESLLLGIASSALIHLGEAPHPELRTVKVDLIQAKQNIDLLELLEVKTRGNLSPAEARFLESLLSDLRLKFVKAKKP